MSRWKLWAGVAVLFLSGVCIGVVGTGIYVHHRVESILQEGPPAVARLITRKLTHDLNLSPEQQKVVERSVRQTQYELHDLRQRHWPEAEQIFSAGINRMRPDLTPEQQKILDQLFAKVKERWKMQSVKKNYPGM